MIGSVLNWYVAIDKGFNLSEAGNNAGLPTPYLRLRIPLHTVSPHLATFYPIDVRLAVQPVAGLH